VIPFGVPPLESNFAQSGIFNLTGFNPTPFGLDEHRKINLGKVYVWLSIELIKVFGSQKIYLYFLFGQSTVVPQSEGI
jgi:hypothetical protein